MSQLPTEDDLQKLPLRSLVAYAARAAMRSRPRFRLQGDGIELVDEAIAAAVAFATNREFDLDAARSAEERVVEAIRLASDPETGDRPSALAANVAYAAANSAIAAAEVDGAPNRSEAANAVVAAVLTATEAAQAVHVQARHGLVKDFASLVNHAGVAFPDLGDPVDVGPNGPLGKLACKPLPDKKGPGPNEVDLLEILRLREEMQSEAADLAERRAALDADRTEIERQRAEFETERTRLETERERFTAEYERLEAARAKALAFAGELASLFDHRESTDDEPATETANDSTDSSETKSAKPQPDAPSEAVVEDESPTVEEPEPPTRERSAIDAVDALLDDLAFEDETELVTA